MRGHADSQGALFSYVSLEQGRSTAAARRDGSGMVDFKGQRRSNATHASSTDPEAKLIKVSIEHQVHKQVRPEVQDVGARVFPMAASIEYLTKTIERLETDVAATRARANAWAVGNIAALRSLIETDRKSVV